MTQAALSSLEAPSSQTLFEGKKSIQGKVWRFSEISPRETLAVSQHFGVSQLIASLLLKRGLSFDQIQGYLFPTLRHFIPNPSQLKDMDKGVARIVNAILNKEKIAIFGDYDVDGATASSVLKRYFRDIGIETKVYIPQRIEEGYGPNSPALQKLQKEGYTLVIMVDCGTTAFEPLTDAAARGQDIIVVDHHISQAALPPAYALINPNRIDEDCPNLTHLCAAGLSFILVVALRRALREANWFKERPEPDILQYLDLVALGTVCDVMPLRGLNRAFVSQGLKVMASRSNQGMRALADIAGLNDYPNAYHLGFLIGPRINAGGRVGKADLGAQLLTTRDDLEARRLAQALDQYNTERKEIEQQVLEQALTQIDQLNLLENPILLVGQDGWHPGVIGIVAGRLKERYSRPACVVGFDGDIGKGSGRSIHQVNLGVAVHGAAHKGHLLYGGGHAMAAGFTVEKSKFQDFYKYLIDQLGEQISSIEPTLDIDGILTPSGVTTALVEELSRLEPYGSGNYTPRFCLHRARISYAEQVGVDHLRCQLVGEDGTRVKAMAFRALNTPLGETLQRKKGQPIEVAGTLKLDTWNGYKNVTFTIEDVMV